MKKQITMLLMFVLALVTIIPAGAQTRKEKKEALKQQIMLHVEARRFKISLTDSGSSQEIARGGIDGSVEIKDTLMISNLPYYGSVHGVQLDPRQSGLNFESPTSEYISSILHDGTAKILFNAKRGNETFVYYIEIKPQGKVTLSVHSDRRSPASYTGEFVTK